MRKLSVLKRKGNEENYREAKVKKVITAIIKEVNSDMGVEEIERLSNKVAEEVTEEVMKGSKDKLIAYTQIYDIICKKLKANKMYDELHHYKKDHEERDMKYLMSTSFFKKIIQLKSSRASEMNEKRENGNIDGNTPMAVMLKVGGETSKLVSLWHKYPREIAEGHLNGDFHIHDLDFDDSCWTCVQIGAKKLLKGGFSTGHGTLREANSILAAAAQMAIIIQANQNDMYGGQAVPTFDYDLAPYVSKSHIRNIAKIAKIKMSLTTSEYKEIYNTLKEKMMPEGFDTVMGFDKDSEIKKILKRFFAKYGIEDVYENTLIEIMQEAYDDTRFQTYNAMEAFIANMNTMHSRCGNQVPFSSINYGTCTTEEGRMITRQILLATERGLGYGEVALFPVQIFKVKKSINLEKGSINRDLFIEACKCSSMRMFPNFVFLDAPYNAELYVEGRPETEMASMGCRTRVGKNYYNPENNVITGRGNISFTSINIVRLAILADHDIDKFFKLLKNEMDIVKKQLLLRMKEQGKATAENLKFLLGQQVWIDSDKLKGLESASEIIKNGTLTFGFIGLAEALVALTGKHHGESKESQELGLKIVKFMRDYADRCSEKEKLNYSVIGTPAEGLSGRFTMLDRERFGIIKGVTDKDYYTNSSHVPVNFNIGAFEKIRIEAPYHALENGGHICYIELDGDPSKNLTAFIKIVEYMAKSGIGYGAINHPIDYDPVCKYTGIINDVCPRCGRKEFEPMSEEMYDKWILRGAAFNSPSSMIVGDIAEEADRVSNYMGYEDDDEEFED